MEDHVLDDFVLELMIKWGRPYAEIHYLVMPNLRGQTYTFGDKYPGDREGEEFVFCRPMNPLRNMADVVDAVEPIHFMITVDDDGRYWIKNATSAAKTFVNEEVVQEPRRLQVGDIISIGSPKSWGSKQELVYRVEDRAALEDELDQEKDNFIPAEAESSELPPMENELILGKILNLLPFQDLLNSRLVCKKWDKEASKMVEKNGQVSFTFGYDYMIPSNSSRVFLYLHEMQEMKIRKVIINLENYYGTTSPGYEKMIDDLQKLLKSTHNFSNLALNCGIDDNSEFIPVNFILQELGANLFELNLEADITFLPKVIPQCPKMSNLRKFVHKCSASLEPGPKSDVCKRWVSHLVPLFRETLEDFSCSRNIAPFYLEEFLLRGMPKLSAITICGYKYAHYQPDVKMIVPPLLRLQNPLVILNLSVCPEDKECASMLEQVVLKNSKSLRHLVLDINQEEAEATTITEIEFPCLPKLKVLELNYSPTTRITWETSLDYEKHFPALEKLKIRFPYEDSLFNWGSEGHVFNSFFPEGSNISCETVKALKIPVLTDPHDADFRRTLKSLDEWEEIKETFTMFQKRLEGIKEMFPKVKKVEMECLSPEQSYPAFCF